MRLRFLLSRRWVLFFLAVLFMAWGAVRLGEWQFHRLHDREQRNAWAERNLAASPVPVADVLAPGRPLPQDREWQRVTATGTYDTSGTFVVRYQTRDGDGGIDVVTPLVLADGSAVLVDRGWMSTQDPRTGPADTPAPPTGQVTIEGWARADATGDKGAITGGSTREISSQAAADLVDEPLLRGFVDLQSESPRPATALVPAEKPDLGNGPHLFYGIQWWFFGALALGGFAYLVWDEARGGNRRQSRRQRPRRSPPSTDSATPVT
jgi:cytochrome oxidase assembly protein ShyY1